MSVNNACSRSLNWHSEPGLGRPTDRQFRVERATVSTQQTSPENPLADFGPNEWIVDDMYQRYLADPDSVDAAWHEFFADYKPVADASAGTTAPPAVAANGAPTTSPITPAPATTAPPGGAKPTTATSPTALVDGGAGTVTTQTATPAPAP